MTNRITGRFAFCPEPSLSTNCIFAGETPSISGLTSPGWSCGNDGANGGRFDMARKQSARGKTVTSHGYVLVWKPEHPGADVRGYIYEHRLVGGRILGRPLFSSEQVHHIDGDKQNNSPENLMVVSGAKEHRVLHRKKPTGRRMPGEDNSVVYCACGCGQMFNKYDSGGRPRKFISGHNPPSSPTKDLIVSILSSGPKLTSQLIKLPQGKPAIASAISKLHRKGLIRQVRHGIWELAKEERNG